MRKFHRYLLLALFISLITLPSPAIATPAQPEINARSLELNESGVKAIRAQNYTRAELFFKKALNADEGNLSAAFNLGGMYLQNKKNKEAIELLTKYEKLAPKDPGFKVRLGDVYFSNKKPKEALKRYYEAYQLAPTYDGLAEKLGTIYILLNDPQSAEVVLLKAAELQPKNHQLLANLSSVLLANGKAQKSVGAAKKALQIKPNPQVYITLGSAYEELKDYNNSLIAFQRAYDLGEKSKELKQKLEQAKQLAHKG